MTCFVYCARYHRIGKVKFAIKKQSDLAYRNVGHTLSKYFSWKNIVSDCTTIYVQGSQLYMAVCFWYLLIINK